MKTIFKYNYCLMLIFLLFTVVLTSAVYAQTGKVKANGITIAYESFGENEQETIILIHGTSAQLTDWPEEFCQNLAEQGYRVIRFDNRDIGLSSKLDSLGEPDWEGIIPFIGSCEAAPLPYTLMDMANDAVGLMDALKIREAHIVGASMGAAIAQLLAIHYPERTLSLVSIMGSSGNPALPQGDEKALQAMSTPPPATNDPNILADYMANISKILGAEDDEIILKENALTHVKRSWHPRGNVRQVAAVLIGDNCDRREELKKLDLPTMVIHGDSDPLVTLESGKEVANTIPGAELQIIEGMGHAFSTKYMDILVENIVKNAKKAGE